MRKEAYLATPLSGGVVQCQTCEHFCAIRAGEAGKCGVRQNVNGTLHLVVYGDPMALPTWIRSKRSRCSISCPVARSSPSARMAVTSAAPSARTGRCRRPVISRSGEHLATAGHARGARRDLPPEATFR